MYPVQIARVLVSFSWVYHGVFPKLLEVAPLEKQMTASLGFDPATSFAITQAAGVAEVLFGLVFFVFYRSQWLNVLNILAMIGLLGFVVVMVPQLLTEAFNPVTTNLPI